MKLQLSIAAAVVCAIAALTGMTTTASAAPIEQAAAPTCVGTTCLTQTTTGTTSTGIVYSLTSTITRFVNQNGALAAVVRTTGTFGGQAITPITSTVPVTQLLAGGSCTILDLTLGPLHLDLLGLVVDLNQVHLTITGQQGPGNLLGNLLCGVANALNGGNGGGIANLLNRLLGL
jgi:hypothetical protein